MTTIEASVAPWLVGALVLVAGCTTTTADDGGSSSNGTYAEKCEIACEPPDGPCEDEDSSECEADCLATTDQLTSACAQCVTENSGWRGARCDTSCPGGCLCDFGPGADECAAGGRPSCTPADDACTGFVIGMTSSSACAAACAP